MDTVQCQLELHLLKYQLETNQKEEKMKEEEGKEFIPGLLLIAKP